MADVRRDDRGQLLLVTALAMATLFVVLALLVNTTIYTGNVASRSDVSESAHVINYRSEAVEAAGSAVGYANRHDNESSPDVDAAYIALNESLRRSVANWSDTTAAHGALSGTASEMQVITVQNGTRIAQTDSSRNLSSPTGATTWSPVTDATGIRGPEMRLATADLATVSDDGDDVGQLVADGSFRVNLTETDGEVRSLFVYERNDGDVGVTVRSPGGTVRTCHAAADGLTTLNARTATFENESCPALRAFDRTDDAFEVSFVAAQNAVGTYSFAIDQRADGTSVAPSLSLDSGMPFYTAAIYTADVNVTYRSPDTYYNATVEVPNASV
ncbi:DUF7261 family protein [Halogeometricum borinquense]|nr:hypothetical protein [Halogeometricum borinquense]